jgi:hypothetical protein
MLSQEISMADEYSFHEIPLQSFIQDLIYLIQLENEDIISIYYLLLSKIKLLLLIV